MKKNMKENFEQLGERVAYSLSNTDTDKIKYELSRIDSATLTSGVGGSSVVALYASKILNEKNGIITRSIEPRDTKYMNISGYKNILACSYSGNNYGVDLSFLNSLKHYLLSSKENNKEGIHNLTYSSSEEHSFISLSATLVPCSILLNYYLNGSSERIAELVKPCDFVFDCECDAYEIFSGYETSVPCKYLESTLVEAGIGVPIIHDKYSYCHGRSTLCTTKNNIAIFFNLDTELDRLLLRELNTSYKDVIVINTKPTLEDEFSLLVKCMYLTEFIARCKNKDLSGVDYNPIVKKLYKYNGQV